MPIKKDNFKLIQKIEDAEEEKINIFKAKNGVFQIIKNKIGYLIKKINIDPFAEETLEEGIILKNPLKIPPKLILTALVFLKKVKEKYKTEAMVVITKKDDEYLLELPEQRVSAVHISYSLKNLVGTPVLIIHCHPGNEINATSFSSIDDKDECFPIFNAVTSIYMSIRIKVGSKFIEIDDTDLFDVDKEWIEEKLAKFSEYVKKENLFDKPKIWHEKFKFYDE